MMRANQSKDLDLRISAGDKEQSQIRYTGKTQPDLNRDVNEVAFEDDTPWGRRPSRAVIGFAKFKTKYSR